MKILLSPHFARSYRKAPAAIQQAFDKQSLLLLQNLRHPSLHAKKYDESADLWQGRVTGSAFLLQDRRRHVPARRD
jgi:mRNA-degrading endonuclease RelE of RelBE toxin-antitoxin system